MNNESTKTNYIVFTIFAFVAVLASSLATYDIAVHFSPPNVKLLWFVIPPSFAGLLAILVLDGLYILLDLRLATFPTTASRNVSIFFMGLVWCIMVSANLVSAIINNTIDGSVLGAFSWVMYGVKLGALLYLGYYTYIRWDDPNTQRLIIQNDLRAVMEKEMNGIEKDYGGKIYKNGGDMIVLVKLLMGYADNFKQLTGQDVRFALGSNWRRTLANMSGIAIPEGFVFPDERADAGSSADVPKGKRVAPSPLPSATNAGTPEPVNAGTSQALPMPVKEEAPSLLQTLLIKTGLVKNANPT